MVIISIVQLCTKDFLSLPVGSTTIVFPDTPTVAAVTKSYIGTPASAKAKPAQVIAAERHDPAFSNTNTKTST